MVNKLLLLEESVTVNGV